MIVTSNIEDVQAFVSKQKNKGNSIGFVPTMGALHDGHVSLVEAAKKSNASCVMSIFVNPTQFGPQEDFAKYPRPIEKDQAMAQKNNVDLLFVPSVPTMFPCDPKTIFVEETSMSTVLCGKYRPGHFRGVCTVVNKLLNIVQPNELFLGEKDAQQLRILQKMVEELRISTKVTGVPTLREPNGLAMSSRNQYLSSEQFEKASIIYRGLNVAKKKFESGEHDAKKLVQAVHSMIETEPMIQIQYLELRSWENLQSTEKVQNTSLLATACYLGETRLIDNVILVP